MKLFVVLFFIAAVSARLSSRITGGQDAKAGTFPSYVALQIEYDSGTRQCGGVLNTMANLILTAASCVVDPSEGKATNVKFAFAQTNDFTKSAYSILDIYPVPAFSASNNVSAGNLAAIAFTPAITVSKTIAGAPLDTSNKDDAFVGQNLVVVGFGVIDNDRNKTKTLKYTTLRVVPVAECKAILSAAGPSTAGTTTEASGDTTTTVATPVAGSGIICTKNVDARNACAGDIGSPVYLNASNVYTAVGVVANYPNARPNARCEDGHYTVVTQLGVYGDFLKDPTTYTTTAAPTTTTISG